jgi:hypothetical protein
VRATMSVGEVSPPPLITTSHPAGTGFEIRFEFAASAAGDPGQQIAQDPARAAICQQEVGVGDRVRLAADTEKVLVAASRPGRSGPTG